MSELMLVLKHFKFFSLNIKIILVCILFFNTGDLLKWSIAAVCADKSSKQGQRNIYYYDVVTIVSPITQERGHYRKAVNPNPNS